ncbi:hypothetical protein Q31b_26190 [Novipirellula aureliae]|uniref:Uncharacterized protein n=1 Tax=Novipirellula aureliae TaxID=2527966 RepID=A0A5C6DWQ9_9BACT|nr:hypothetical protein Q31b_26190 [Novipirellula aureliae]
MAVFPASVRFVRAERQVAATMNAKSLARPTPTNRLRRFVGVGRISFGRAVCSRHLFPPPRQARRKDASRFRIPSVNAILGWIQVAVATQNRQETERMFAILFQRLGETLLRVANPASRRDAATCCKPSVSERRCYVLQTQRLGETLLRVANPASRRDAATCCGVAATTNTTRWLS